MKNLLRILSKAIFTLAISLTFVSCAFGQKGNGNVIKQDRVVDNFTAIEVGGAFDVYLRQGDKDEVTVVTDDNLMDLITTNVSGGTLRIKSKKDINKPTELKVYVTVTNLKSLEASGASNVTGKNTINSQDLMIELSGASDLELEVSCKNLMIDASGASDAKLRGSAGNAEIDASGASTIIAMKLNTRNALIDASGASTVKVAVSENLEADSSGASSILYKGDPHVSSNVSGAGTIKKM